MAIRFGSSGVRGPVATVMTPEVALALGRAIGRRHRRVLIGRDARTTSASLGAILYGGLLAEGCDVRRAGLAPTPAIAYGARRYDAAVVVTASHNPPEDNGFKLWNPDGSAFGARERQELADTAQKLLDTPAEGIDWARSREGRDDPTVLRRHADAVVALVGPLDRPLRVIVDAGNGVGGLSTPRILQQLGCDVVTLNAQPDGRFPGRPSEPSAENIEPLCRAVQASGADFGIAHDGDADRCVAVSGTGRVVSGDHLAALLCHAALDRHQEGRKRIVAVPVDMSLAFEEALRGWGHRVEMRRTPVGDAFVSDALAESGGAWGGEASGAYIFPGLSHCPDGPLAAAMLARVVGGAPSLDALVESLPAFFLRRESVRLDRPSDVPALLERVRTRLESLGGRVATIDGVRVDFDDGWVLVRASGTEPKVRLTVEGRTEAARGRMFGAAQDAIGAAAPG